MTDIDPLYALVARLRGPNGCPWDRAQTPKTVRGYLLEEAYEVASAIDDEDDAALMGELGDLLFNVVTLAHMAEARGAFTLVDVMHTIQHKMVRRHPHVFGDADSADPDEVQRTWQALKAEEHPERTSALDGVPASLPALARGQALSNKASKVGFDWPDATGPRQKVDEELAELDEAMANRDPSAMDHELGDVLFSVVNLARHLPIEGAEASAQRVNRRFERRFRQVESLAQAAGATLSESDEAQLEAWWAQAKVDVG
ncbi:MAG: nucleoside triphosphate pyrophosphohydrolase [Myxococcota bacterium]